MYFEVEGYSGATTVTTPSNIISAIIPTDNGDTGTLLLAAIGGGFGQGTVEWTNPVQGYRAFQAASSAGPFSMIIDTGSTLGSLDYAFSGTVPPTGCLEVQGYSQTGVLGPIEGPTCF
jgi:hypothetical protein